MAGKGFIGGGNAGKPADVVGGPLSTISTGSELGEAAGKLKPRLRIWDRLGLSREMSAITREKLGEITAAIVEAQKAEIVQSLMLSLDLKKKEQFAAYLDRVGTLNGEIIKRSQAMERDLAGSLSEELEKIYEDKKKWETRVDDMKSRGLLDEKDHIEEMQRKSKWIDIMKDNLDAKIELVMRNHATSLQTTLELLRDKAIKGSEAM